jgi:hypothetical protein
MVAQRAKPARRTARSGRPWRLKTWNTAFRAAQAIARKSRKTTRAMPRLGRIHQKPVMNPSIRSSVMLASVSIV